MPQSPLEIQLKVMDNVDALLGYWDNELRCRFANAAYKVWFGKTREEVVGMSMKDLLGPLFELNLPHIRAVLQGEIQIFERDISLPDGSVRHSLASPLTIPISAMEKSSASPCRSPTSPE